MADLTKVLGGPWSPSAPVVKPPEDQLRAAMLDAGLNPPDRILMDGRLHRWSTGSKGKPGHDKSGWYVAFADGVPAGRFGDWRTDLDVPWRADIGRRLSPAEEVDNLRRVAEAQAARDAEVARERAVAASAVSRIWSQAGAASPDHPYLRRKGIQVHGARVAGDGRLMVPLYTPDGELSSLQYIAEDGGKLYHPGGMTRGCLWMIGVDDSPGTIYVAEGFATAATIHQVTQRPVLVAYSASNLVPVVASWRERAPHQDIVIVADNDASGVGERYAEQAAARSGARVIVPPAPGDANDYVAAGGDLAALLLPPLDDWLIPADEFSAQPAPISWLIRRWLQADSLIMIHGQSGGGKTFVVLDMALHLAAGMADWFGMKVRPCSVVYLAGEGHHGLRGRVAAWKHHHAASSLNMWLSRDGLDLNTPQGYSKVADRIRALPVRPGLIVVDTLHRFLHGDENSAQDAKTMLDACNALQREFSASVILVHHTGVSEEAQHRARGSSSWRGALDIEISVVPAKDDDPIQLVQRKSKDAELAEPLGLKLTRIEIPGWVDEDGEQVASAIVTQQAIGNTQSNDENKKNRGEKQISREIRTFTNAWNHSGRQTRNSMPYISRSALIDHLVDRVGISLLSAKQYTQAGKPNRMISNLIAAEIISPNGDGWVVSHAPTAAGIVLQSKVES